MRPLRFLAVLALAAPLAAQDDTFASRFRLQIGFGAGEFEHRTDGTDLDDDTDAAMFRFHAEAASHQGFGGGVRFEGLASDDDLFEDAGFSAAEANMASLFLHFTYRVQARRFQMPVRFGLWLNGYELEDQATGDDIDFGSIGPWIEFAPEIRVIDQRDFSWSFHLEAGAGVAATGIDVEGDDEDYHSTTAAFGVELGTRLRGGPVEFGLAFVNRWQTMDESDVENGFVVLGYDAEFHGLLVTFGARF